MDALAAVFEGLNAVDAHGYPLHGQRKQSMQTLLSQPLDLDAIGDRLMVYLGSSVAVTSAELLEDEFALDLSTPECAIHYDGRFNFLADHLVPDWVSQERAIYRPLVSAFLHLLGQQQGEGRQYENLVLLTEAVKQTWLCGYRLPGLRAIATEFVDCRFSDADLSQAKLDGCRFVACEFDNVNFSQTDFRGSRFEQCRFSACQMSQVVLQGAVLIDCELNAVELSMAKLKGCQLSNTRFETCYLGQCDLRKQQGMTQDDLAACLGGEDTRLPAALHAPDFWPHNVDVFTWKHWLSTAQVKESRGCLDYQ